MSTLTFVYVDLILVNQIEADDLLYCFCKRRYVALKLKNHQSLRS